MADDVNSQSPRDSADSALSVIKMANDEESEPEPLETHFLDLPPEIIRGVLSYPVMTMTDVSRLAQTCQTMNALVSGDCNDVWRTMHLRRWPEANKALLAAASASSSPIDWHAECKLGLHLVSVTNNVMDETWPKIYTESEVCYSHYAPLRRIIEEQKSAYYYIKDYLASVIYDVNVGDNLTLKYQAKRVFTYIYQDYIKNQIKIFKALPDEEKVLEIGVGFVSQWCRPWADITPEILGNQFDQLSASVLGHLADNHPDHPLFMIPEDERKKWGKQNLPSDMWNASRCMQILRSMDHVLINCLGLHGTKEHYHHRENYLIDVALSTQQGVPLTLNVIVECVARRLGVRLVPWYRGHFVMKWNSDKNPDLGDVYLDAFNGGSLIHTATYMGNAGSGSGCPFRDLSCLKGSTSCMEIIERLTAGIEVAGRISMRNSGNSSHLRSALELMFVINPKNLTYILHLARLYMLHNISVSDLIDSITSIIDELPADARKHAENILQMFKVYSPEAQSKPSPVPKTRALAPGVEFAIGMTILHKKYDYLGVIVGWDPLCAATETWQYEMGVHLLEHKNSQPFYNVLVPDGTTRYAAQENLEPLRANDVFNTFNTHPDVGRYFESFRDGYYVPNGAKLAEYPEDLTVCQQYYSTRLQHLNGQ